LIAHRIARIIARLNIGGPAINATLLAAGLNHGRWASTLIAGSIGLGEGDMSHLATQCGITPTFVPELGPELGWRNDAIALRRLHGVLRELRPTIMHTHTAKAGALGRAAALRLRPPIIVHTFHGHVFRGYFSERKARAFLKIERALARRTSALIAVSERLRTELAEEFRVAPRARIHVIPLGFELGPFFGVAARRGQLRRELGLADGVPLVGIVGRLVPIKQHDLFLEAAALLISRLPLAHFIIVGDGELRPALEAQTARLGLTAHTHFLGWQRDMAAVYADLDVLALTSRNEGTPVALIEAQASGLPVVATNVGGVADTMREGETGWLVEASAEAVAERLEQVLSDDGARQVARIAGPEWTRHRFAKERLLRDMAELYDRLLAERGQL